MREVSRPVRRKEIGDVLRGSNAPISYPTKDTESISKSRSMSPGLEMLSGESKRRGTVAHASPKIPFLQGVCHFLQIVSEGTHLQVRCPPII
jgi:hypothetical protein